MNQFNNMGNPMGNVYGYQPQFQPRQRLLKCYPVTSIEEARSAMIDLDGSVTLFADMANGKIYAKSVDLNGLAVMQTYELAQAPQPAQTLEQRMDNMEALIGEMKGELENVKSSAYSVNKPTQRKSKSSADDESITG